jgi:CubicO group peptidase (beta-lactamase class C family)
MRFHFASASLVALFFLSGLEDPLPAQSAASAAAPTAAPPDLANARPRPFDDRMAAELSGYIAGFLDRARAPGAAVAIVEGGKVVYAKGFGVRELGKPDPVTPQTLMMIGSTGKSMTTLMMATLVEEGRIAWDTPAVKIYPGFVSSDPELTARITLRDMVCNCTGVQRHDLEMYFAAQRPTAEEVIRSLKSFAFVGDFGKTFGYVNQMVAAGGYIAAWAARGPSSDLYSNYVNQMQRRVFDPIGMASTTFSFERVRSTNHATPHGLKPTYEYTPIPLDLEKSLEPLAPAGGAWSNAEDMTRYLIVQLSQGISANGTRVVSANNLRVTWQPQIEMQPGASYALGWGVAKYKGQRLLSHGGGTAGFSSDLTFLPDADLGIVVLTNAQNANLFGAAVRSRVIELAFGQPMEMDTRYAADVEYAKGRFHEKSLRRLSLDPTVAAAFQGTYQNEALGEAGVTFSGGKLKLVAGGFTSELKNVGGGTYILWDPPLAGAVVHFARGEQGQTRFVFDADDPDVPEKYVFVKAAASSSLPSGPPLSASLPAQRP